MRRRQFIASVGAAAGLSATSADTVLAAEGSEVEVITNDHRVPHVYADDLYSVAFGEGYVQADERLFEMDVLRLMGYGRSAEVLGDHSLLSQDVRVRRDLYSRAEIEDMYRNAPADMQTMIRGFADGVNRRLAEFENDGTLPGEYQDVRDPPPWEPEDSVAVTAFLLSTFGVGGGDELANAQKLAQLTSSLGSRSAAFDAYGDLNWLRVPDSHTASTSKTVEGGETVPSLSDVPDEQLSYVDPAFGAELWGVDHSDVTLSDVGPGDRTASNAVVVGGQHTKKGTPIIFGGPQMGLFKPPVIYEVGLHGAGFDVTGCGIVGAPGVVFGRTPNFTWTVTSGRDDQIDTIAVDLDPDDRHRYEWNGEFHRMETATVTHDLPDETVEQEIARIREDGEVMPVVAWNPDANVAWARRTTTRYDELVGAARWTQLGRQSDLAEFRSAVSEFPFTFNFLYADRDNIAMFHTNKVPDRGSTYDPRFPVPGPDLTWSDVQVGLDAGLEETNPDRGYFANWNNAPAVGWRAGDVEQNWGSVHRGDLLDDLVQEYIQSTNGKMTYDDVGALLQDSATRDTVAWASTPELVAGARTSSDDLVNDMATELEEWASLDYTWDYADGSSTYSTGGMAIWEEVRRELQSLVFEDELGQLTPVLEFDPKQSSDPHAGDHGRFGKEVTFVDVLHGRTSHDWCNGSCDALVREAFRRAGDTLSERFGGFFGPNEDPSDWTMDKRTIEWTPIGAAETSTMQMINRGSWNHVVAIDQKLGQTGGVLPPSNMGYLSDGEVINIQLGFGEPDRLTDQLDEYEAFEFFRLPVTRKEVERVYKQFLDDSSTHFTITP